MENPVLTVRLPKTEHLRLTKIAAHHGLTRSEWIRAVLERALLSEQLSLSSTELCTIQNNPAAIASATLSTTI